MRPRASEACLVGGSPAVCCGGACRSIYRAKVALGLSAAFMPVVMLVPHVPVRLGAGAVQHCVLLPAVLVGLDHDPARRHLSAVRGGYRCRDLSDFGGAIGGAIFGVVAGFLLGHGFGYGTLFFIVGTFHLVGFLPSCYLGAKFNHLSSHDLREIESQIMKITEVRTRVVQWEGKTVPLPPHFCTNPMDLVCFREASMGNFRFHGWVMVEIFTDAGLVGLGNAALSPLVTKTLIDTYLKPLLLGADPVGHRVSVAAHVSPDHGIRAQGRRHDGDQRGRYRALGSAGKSRETTCVSPARRANEGTHPGVCQPSLQPCRSTNSRRGAALQGRRIQGDEAAFRLGAGGWREGMQRMSSWCAPCAK